MKERNAIDITIEKMRKTVLNNKDIINIILGITESKNSKIMYRKHMRMEAYSLVSRYRFWQRLRNNDFTSYHFNVLRIIENANIIDIDKVEILFINDYINDISEIYDIGSIKRQFEIDIYFAKNKVVLTSNNKLAICRFMCLILCDVIDLGIDANIFCDKKYLDATCELLNQKIAFDFNYANFYDINQNYTKLSHLCGLTLIGNEVVVEPYRLEVCTFSQVLSDIIDMNIKWPMTFERLSDYGKGYNKMYNIQNFLKANGYSNCSFFETNLYVDKNLEKKIIDFEVQKRNIKQPHMNFCITEPLKLTGISNIIIWSSGKKINVNDFADKIRNVVLQEFGDDVIYNSMGEKIVFKKNNCVIAEIWIANNKDSNMKRFNIFNLVIAKIIIDKEKCL